ncbi:hypothetical protein C0J08_15855 [Marinomonas sp. CT5]|uniref:hypothetical protein n=1 Tax=Marinomonas sp. CT5 TaxID=2066133 RepID=UPI001BAF442C|nr:hypothetical protein [Marinomonas sp. CT5]QUX96779.1 hypothetical protein C0J08_15855 [Marinomonas sp. CT5]
MMSEDQARYALVELVNTYLSSDPEINNLLKKINDNSKLGLPLPIRGVLESMREYRTIEYSELDKEIIEELLYLYG